MALIREHQQFPGRGWCRWCGVLINAAGSFGTATCIAREDGFGERCPEPARRQMAHEDTDAITARRKEIGAATAEARIALACAARQGRGVDQCEVCTFQCKACARAQNAPIATCVVCRTATGGYLPCPRVGAF